MKIIFLKKARADLVWFQRYYSHVFPEGKKRAQQNYQAFLQLLKSNPLIGKPALDVEGAHELKISNTPFGVIYRVTPTHIEILRVYDGRSEFSNQRG